MLRIHRSIPALLLFAACGSEPAEAVPDAGPNSDAHDADVETDAELDTESEPDAPWVGPDAEDVEPADTLEDSPQPPDATEPDTTEPDAMDVAPDTTEPDATEPDVAEPDAMDVAPDTVEDRCAPPIRMSPTRGPAAGGTRVEIYGDAWYIGALWWVAEFDETVVDEVYDELPREECTLYFETPPHAPGEVQVSVAYGGRSPEIDMPFGTFIYE